MNSISTTLEYISLIISFTPLAIALLNRKYIEKHLTPIFLFVIISAIFEVLGRIFMAAHLSRVVVFYIYTLIEFTLVSLFYSIFLRTYTNTAIINSLIPIFIIISFIFSRVYDLLKADHYALALEAFIFTCYCLFLFYFIMKRLIFEHITQSPVFWINTGIMFYFSGNLVIFIFSSYITNHLTGGYALLWDSIHTFFNVAMNVLFSIGFWKTRVK